MQRNTKKINDLNVARTIRSSPIVQWLEESLTVLPITSSSGGFWISTLALTGSAIVLVISLLFPHNVNYRLDLPLDAAFAAISFGAYRLRKRFTRTMANSLVAIATVMITLQIAFGYGRDPAILGVVFYVWIALYTFAFLIVLDSLIQISWIVVCYSLALLLGDKPSAPLADWILTVSTVIVASISAGYLTFTIQKIAVTDPLTGVNNRKGWEIHSEREITRAKRNGHLIAVTVMDLDNFKEINDHGGHHEGDRVLASLGSTLTAALRPFDVIARWGGDEFVILASIETVTQGEQLIERIFACASSITQLCCGSVISLPNEQLLDLIRVADRELYQAKIPDESSCRIQSLA